MIVSIELTPSGAMCQVLAGSNGEFGACDRPFPIDLADFRLLVDGGMSEEGLAPRLQLEHGVLSAWWPSLPPDSDFNLHEALKSYKAGDVSDSSNLFLASVD